MSTKNRKISYLIDAIAQIKAYQSQDSGKNPVLSEAFKKNEITFLNELYEEKKSLLKKPKKTSIAKSREPKNQGFTGDQIGDPK